MITLRKITLENRRQIFNLDVSEEQRQFVASNLLEYSPRNTVAERMYKNVGFSDNGEIVNDEVVALLEL